MPKLKLFKHFVTKRKIAESLSQPTPPPPAETNPLVKQQQISTLGTRPIPNTPSHFSRATEATLTLEKEDGFIHYHTGPNSATTMKQVSHVPQTQNTSHQVQDPQHESNHSIVGKSTKSPLNRSVVNNKYQNMHSRLI